MSAASADENFKYDVAFSFLAADIEVAKDLCDRLPGLRTFVYERHKEELLGRDGMEAFAEVFGKAARLAVILHRDGWGHTDWTAFEESHIKARALKTRMTSFMVVRLDESELPSWVPVYQLYSSEKWDTRDQTAAVIRARALERGAIVRALTAAEIAVQRARETAAARAREQRMRSPEGQREVLAEVQGIFSQIEASVQQMRDEDSGIPIQAGYYGNVCVITGGGATTTLSLQALASPRPGVILREEQFEGDAMLPTAFFSHPVGRRELDTSHYRATLSTDNEWVWYWDPDLDGASSVVFLSSGTREQRRSSEFAEYVLRRHVERVYGRG